MIEQATDCLELIPICANFATQTDSKRKIELSIEANVVGAFEIIKDVFNSSARPSIENKCHICSKKDSKGSKGSKGEGL